MSASRPPPPLPLTTIIVPAHDCWELTKACIDSVREHTQAPYEIVLIDDASGPEAAELMRDLRGDDLRLIRNEERRSYSFNNNQASRLARGKYLCLLNNDTEVTPRWLSGMVAILEQDEKIAVLGNKHLFPGSGLLHHCGMALDRQGHPTHLHPHSDPAAPAVNYQRDLQMVSFACVVIAGDVYRQLSGLDESFRNGYEDCDFCLLARKEGYRVVYTPASTICHHGQATPGRTDTDSENWRVFKARWEGKVERDLEDITGRDREYNEKIGRRLLPRPEPGLHFAVDMGQPSAFTWATAELIGALLELGEAISILPGPVTGQGIPPDRARMLKGLMKSRPKGTCHLKWSHYWPQYMRQPLSGDLNAEFFCTNYRYRPGNQLDYWSRHVAANSYRKIPVSRFNRQALEDFGVDSGRCPVVPLGYSPEIPTLFPDGRTGPDLSGPLRILLVTNSNDLYRYGTDLAVEALAGAFSPSEKVVVHIKDYGASSGNPQLKQWIAGQPRFPEVKWHNDFLPKEDLLRLYASMDLMLSPFRGEGFSMKILDSMAIGVPVMMPLFGGPKDYAAPGTCLAVEHDEVDVGECYDRHHSYLGEGAFWCQASREDLVEQLRSLGDRRQELRETGERARSHVLPLYSWQAAAGKLRNTIGAWEVERLETVVPRREPSRVPLSVLIPTKDRSPELGRTLEAYCRQSLPAERYELLLINDHGDSGEFRKTADPFGGRLPLRLIDNRGKGGPAAARNLGIEQARGEVVLFTGDDIIPESDCLSEHLAGHEKFPSLETALVGRTLWHPDLPVTPFHDYIAGKGGQQFNYRGMKHGRKTLFDRFYTSNCSMKRPFLVEEEQLFSTAYRYAACEDIEIGYRLHLRGMELRFWERARGFHLHQTTPRSFTSRQYRVGQMLTVMALQHPSFMPLEHMGFIDALECMRCLPGQIHPGGLPDRWDRVFTDALLAFFERILSLSQAELPEAEVKLHHDFDQIKRWFPEAAEMTFEALNEILLRLGMAEEWAMDESHLESAREWVLLLSLPRVLGPHQKYWDMPFVAPASAAAAFLPDSRLVRLGARIARDNPTLYHAIKSLGQSRFGQWSYRLAIRYLSSRSRHRAGGPTP